ncbi:MAG: segregation/condensation protein A [Myxococcales bacterium]|nr:segregation/condensation protein A [Myxococcales bacterium]
MSSPVSPEGSPSSAGVGPAGDANPLELGSPYAVKLPLFEGPLDLLLHLIRLNEVEITDIPIALVAEQYLSYIELMSELDLDVAGEYLVMAATLAWIKSRMLLPPDGKADADDETDPRAELVARLMEYQRFKEVAGQLGERRLLGRDVFSARGPGPEPVPDEQREVEVGLFELLDAFRQALKAEGPSGAAHEVEIETITVRDRMVVVMKALELRDTLEFGDVIRGEDGGTGSRRLLVTTFLAILELTRLQLLRLSQSLDESRVPRGPIHLRRPEDVTADQWTERIADVM